MSAVSTEMSDNINGMPLDILWHFVGWGISTD